MTRSRDRIYNLGLWLERIGDRASQCDELLNDLMLNTIMYNVAPLLAIDPILWADNDHEATPRE